MKTIAISNQKGGVSKTATAHNLAFELANGGYRVLLIDLDSQGSLTAACGIKAGERSMFDVMGDANPGAVSLADIIVAVEPYVHLAPSDIDLAASEANMRSQIAAETVLKRHLEGIEKQYDVSVIDCPPNLGILVINALAACDVVIIPAQPVGQDLRGLGLLLRTLKLVQQTLNPKIRLLGILPTFYDSRLKAHQETLAALHKGGMPILASRIGRSIRIAEAEAIGETLAQYDPSNPQVGSYNCLGQEVSKWLNGTNTH